MKNRISNRPLEPIATVVRFLLRIYALLLIIGVLLSFTGHFSAFGWNPYAACVDAVYPPVTIGGSALKPGVTGGATSINICTNHPSAGQSALSTLNQTPSFLFFFCVLVLIGWLLREADKRGLYSALMPVQLRRLGWFLLVGGLVVMIAQGEAASHLAATMLDNVSPWDLDYWQIPWATVLIALGVLSFARIMRIGSAMRDDLDGTV